jgi:hypothetical protein
MISNTVYSIITNKIEKNMLYNVFIYLLLKCTTIQYSNDGAPNNCVSNIDFYVTEWFKQL